MANIVKDIVENSRTMISGVLGVDWQELRYFYGVENNDERSAKKGFNVIPLGASSVETVLKFYTLDQTFELVLVDTVTRDEGDTEKEVVLFEMYNQADEIFIKLVNSKVNGLASVLLVAEPSISTPEFLDDNKFVVLRMQYVVKYRSPTGI